MASSTTLAQFSQTNLEDESATTEFHFATEKMLNSSERDDFERTTEIADESVEIETTTEQLFDSPSTIESEEMTTMVSQVQNEIMEESSTRLDMENLRSEMKTKVSRVMIFKRPILKRIHDSSTTESMVIVTQAEEVNYSLRFAEMVFIELVAKGIIYWKTSLMALVILLLVLSLIYYRRRVSRLKAEIIQKNLGSPYNVSCSYPYSTNNAYTPTCFPRRIIFHESKMHSNYQGSSLISDCYSQTYNSSLHSYESIDEHIYAEIPNRKISTTSSNSKSSNHLNISGKLRKHCCRVSSLIFENNFRLQLR